MRVLLRGEAGVRGKSGLRGKEERPGSPERGWAAPGCEGCLGFTEVRVSCAESLETPGESKHAFLCPFLAGGGCDLGKF